eukprot:CAMPEP_0176237644 /NCGR_PEP_ID=MMETSP0121_2-20121125/27955_1 /TAXON_ID=160619 /ORGANISM="Kryptoperidinium foliaceum, Strain CCMP 1326" /LENGTH=50 /DNA_ID=CAMNT_0017577093 /DNA_START=138 /DNA_END=287 /DNA_ORIENTATION=-
MSGHRICMVYVGEHLSSQGRCWLHGALTSIGALSPRAFPLLSACFGHMVW